MAPFRRSAAVLGLCATTAIAFQRSALPRRYGAALEGFASPRGATFDRRGIVRQVLSENPRDTTSSPDEDPLWLQHDQFNIYNLLLQRAIQLLCLYCESTDNRAKSLWLTNFLNHTHLDSGWHSINGLRVPFEEYLRELMREPAHRFRVKQRTVGEEDWQEIEHHVQPAKAAESLMMLCAHLSDEWRQDLNIIAEFDNEDKRKERAAKLKRSRKIKEAKIKNAPDVKPVKGASDLLQLTDSTPHRRMNFDLLERASTVRAIKSFQVELMHRAMTSRDPALELVWFDKFVEPWLEQLAGVTRNQPLAATVVANPPADSFFEALEHCPPSIQSGKLIDPPAIAERLRGHREKSALKLAKQLEYTGKLTIGLQKEQLERALEL